MNEKFFDLNKEKQDRMINAALKVFGRNGYRHASTDEIVAEAGISKGLLFHYFINKSGLYDFIFNYSVRFMILEISRQVKKDEVDFFTLFLQIEAAKLSVLHNYPHMQRFLDSIEAEDAEEALQAAKEKRHVLSDMAKEIMKRADMSLFKPEIDGERLKGLLRYVVDGIHNDNYLGKSPQSNTNTLRKELEAYLEMMKALTYLEA